MERDAAPIQTRRRFYGWQLVWAGSFIIGIGAFPPSLFTWSGEEQPLVVGGILLLFLIFLPFLGRAIDRWGARCLTLWALAGLGVNIILATGTPFLLVSSATYALMAHGAELLTLLIATAVNNWFRRRRATAMAVVMLSSTAAFVIVIALPVAGFSAVIGGSSVLGLGIGIGAFILAIAWPVSRLVRNRPEDYGQHPDGVESEDSAAAWPDYTSREALRARGFWFITVGRALVGSGFSGFAVLSGLLMIDAGFSSLSRGGVIAVQVLISMPFSLVAGILGDRFSVRWTMFAFTLLALAGLLVLLLGRTLPLFYLSAALVGAGTNGAFPLVYAIHGAYFGRRNFATIIGMGWPMALLAGVMAPIAVGAAYEYVHSFYGPLSFIAVVIGAGALMFATLGAPRLSPSQRQQANSAELSVSA